MLTNATFPYLRRLAKRGWQDGAQRDPALLAGLNIVGGKVTYAGVAEAFGLEHTDVATVLH